MHEVNQEELVALEYRYSFAFIDEEIIVFHAWGY